MQWFGYDVYRLQETTLSSELTRLTEEIYALTESEFNIKSTQQLGEILFVKLGLKGGKKTKTGYSTDVSVLEKLSLTYELPRLILEYREKAKLKSTYLDALPEMIHPQTQAVPGCRATDVGIRPTYHSDQMR